MIFHSLDEAYKFEIIQFLDFMEFNFLNSLNNYSNKLKLFQQNFEGIDFFLISEINTNKMDPLKDPANDRHVKTLKPPPHRPLMKSLMFPDKLKSI